jgi:hypothetical protein
MYSAAKLIGKLTVNFLEMAEEVSHTDVLKYRTHPDNKDCTYKRDMSINNMERG